MARRIQVADGNFTTAATWAACLTAAATELDAETAQALSTSNADTATFTPPNTGIDGFCLKLAANTQAAGVTMTVHFRNTTTAANDRSVTVNSTDMPLANTTSRNGGWQFFKFSSTLTPNGTDVYLIRVVLSAGTSISLYRDGTTANFSRFIRSTTTGAPAAADRLICCRELTGAGTGTNHTMTMDNIASTVFGFNTSLSTSSHANGGAVNAAFCIGNGCTVTWGNTASTNYLLRLTGSLMIYAGGTWVRGASGAAIPRSSTAVLEFVETTSGDSGIGYMEGASGFTEQGESRTAAKDVIWCLLNTDEAIAQTVLGVDTDTGWLNGDSIAIASTSRTQSEGELRTLNGDAGATTVTVSAGLTNAHGGNATSTVQAELVLLTRNVVTRSDNAARFWKITMQNAPVTMRWVQWSLTGAANDAMGGTTQAFLFEYCSLDRPNQTTLLWNVAANNNFTVRHCTIYTTTNAQIPTVANLTTSTWELTDIVSVFTNGGGPSISTTAANGFGEVHDFRSTGQAIITTAGIPTGNMPANFGNILVHSTGSGITLQVLARNRIISGLRCWRTSGVGLSVNSGQWFYSGMTLKDCVFFGNTTNNVVIDATLQGEITFDNPTIAGDTTFSTTNGMSIPGNSTSGRVKIRLLGGTFGGGGGTKTTHTGADILWGNASVGKNVELVVNNTNLLSATEVTQGTGLRQPDAYYRQAPDGSLPNTIRTIIGMGTVAYNTSVVDSPHLVSEHLIPTITFDATLKSSPILIAVVSGVAPTVNVRVRYSAGYNGAFKPRMVVFINPSVGVMADTVIDTAPGSSADTWLTIGGVLPTPTADGKMLLAVEISGSADGAFVSEWTSDAGEAVEPDFWFDALSGGEMGAGGGGSSGGTRVYGAFG